MATNVQIPPLGESVTEAVLLRWIKEEGEVVSVDEPILELETDKANVELPATAAGVLKRIKKAGDTVRIGETVAQIEAGTGATVAKKKEAAAPPPPAAKAEAPKPQPKPEPVAPPAPTHAGRPADALSPSVRRLVREHGVNPEELHGTGPRGRVVREDVLAAAEAEPQRPVVAKAPVVVSDVDGIRTVPMTKIRKKIAERLVQAQHQAAMLTTFNEVDMTEVLELREKYKERFKEAHGVSLGLMSFFARAAAVALKEFPAINAQIDGENIVYHDYVHLSVAVSTERGLVVPVLRHVEKLSFAKIESEIKRMAGAARDGKLGLQELGGGTFTITNGGVFGSLLSTPILNSPQSGILGLHAIQKRPVVRDDKIEVRSMMYVALSYDHRLVDGRESVSFLVRIKSLLEDPSRLMLEI